MDSIISPTETRELNLHDQLLEIAREIANDIADAIGRSSGYGTATIEIGIQGSKVEYSKHGFVETTLRNKRTK